MNVNSNETAASLTVAPVTTRHTCEDSLTEATPGWCASAGLSPSSENFSHASLYVAATAPAHTAAVLRCCIPASYARLASLNTFNTSRHQSSHHKQSHLHWNTRVITNKYCTSTMSRLLTPHLLYRRLTDYHSCALYLTSAIQQVHSDKNNEQ